MPGQFGRRQSTLGFNVSLPPALAKNNDTIASTLATTAHHPRDSTPSSLARGVRNEASLAPFHQQRATLSGTDTANGYSSHAESIIGWPRGAEGGADNSSEVAGLNEADIMREQCVLLVCQRCQQV